MIRTCSYGIAYVMGLLFMVLVWGVMTPVGKAQTPDPLGAVVSKLDETQLDRLLDRLTTNMDAKNKANWASEIIGSEMFSNLVLLIFTTFGMAGLRVFLKRIGASDEQVIMWESLAAGVEKVYREHKAAKGEVKDPTPEEVLQMQNEAWITALQLAKESGVQMDAKMKQDVARSWITQIVNMRKRGVSPSLEIRNVQNLQ